MDVKLIERKLLTREARHVVQAYSLVLGVEMRRMPYWPIFFYVIIKCYCPCKGEKKDFKEKANKRNLKLDTDFQEEHIIFNIAEISLKISLT